MAWAWPERESEDVFEHRRYDHDPPDPPLVHGRVVLDAIGAAAPERHDAAGEGTELHLRRRLDSHRGGAVDITATALEWRGRVVHLAAFAVAAE